jgi:RNA-binding protein YlmH
MGDLLSERLAAAARGGKVAASGFLEPNEADRLAAELRAKGVAVSVTGGYPGARRRVVTAHPTELPTAGPALTALYAPGLSNPQELRAALRQRGLEAEEIGDVLKYQDGLGVVVIRRVKDRALSLRALDGLELCWQEVALMHLGSAEKRRQAIVPALRLDTLGAKAFGVSRAYFSKGIAGGKVSINGRPAHKAGEVSAGDEVFAEGLGRFRLLSVTGETRRGNLKVELLVER